MTTISYIRKLGVVILAVVALNLPLLVKAEPIVLDGLIEPYLVVKIGTPTPGIIEVVKVDRGDRITKGQALAELQSGVEKATMELARFRAKMESTIKAKQEKLNFTRRKEKRMEQLHKKAIIAFEEMDEAKTNSALALLELQEARNNKRLAELELKRSIEVVKRLTIYSPITGVVMERFLSPGEYIEDQPILKAAQIDPLNVEVFVPVEFLGKIKVGTPAEVFLEEPLKSVHKTNVKISDQVVDAASGTFGVRLELPNPEYTLPAGLKCKVTFLE